MDQAQKLREIINIKSKGSAESKEATADKDARIIAISSGKGGVGKTNFTVNLALALTKLNKRVAIVDADLGLANIDVVLGLVPKHTLSSVLREEKSIEDIILEGPEGIQIVSGGSGVMDLVDLGDDEINKLIESFEYLNHTSDYILIDTGAGLNKSVLSFIKAASDLIMVVTPDPTSITDAYAVIKNIGEQENQVKVVINRIESNDEGNEVFNKINLASKKFLKMDLENIGYLYEDSNVRKAVRNQKPFLLAYPNSLASKGIEIIAYNLINNSTYASQTSGFKQFINKLLRRI